MVCFLWYPFWPLLPIAHGIYTIYLTYKTYKNMVWCPYWLAVEMETQMHLTTLGCGCFKNHTVFCVFCVFDKCLNSLEFTVEPGQISNTQKLYGAKRKQKKSECIQMHPNFDEINAAKDVRVGRVSIYEKGRLMSPVGVAVPCPPSTHQGAVQPPVLPSTLQPPVLQPPVV